MILSYSNLFVFVPLWQIKYSSVKCSKHFVWLNCNLRKKCDINPLLNNSNNMKVLRQKLLLSSHEGNLN